MRTLAIFGILASVGLVTICLVMGEFLENLDTYTSSMGGELTPLVVGELYLFVFDAEAWWLGTSDFEISLRSLINVWAGVMMLVIGAGLMLLLGKSSRRSPAVFGVCALLAGTIPYCIGAMILAFNTEPTKAGYWLHFMICGPIYAAGLCICACLAQFSVVRQGTSAEQRYETETGLQSSHS